MYNDVVKNQFLETVKNKNEFVRLFTLTNEQEKSLEKDLYEFPIEELLKYRNDQDTLRLVYEYIDWSIRMALKKNNINPVASMIDWEDDE